MPRTEKVERVAELRRRMEGAEALFLADFRGLSVADATDLRRSLRESGTRFAIVKNTLMKRAVGQAGAGELEPLLEGPTAVAFVDGDPIMAAKSLMDAIRRFRTMQLKGGYMEGRVLSASEAESLATIAPREVLLSQVAGLAKAQMSRAAAMMQAVQSRFLAVLDAFKEKLAPEEPRGEARPEAESEHKGDENEEGE